MKKFLFSLLAISVALFASGQTFTDMTSILNSPSGSSQCISDMNNDGLDDVVSVSGANLKIDYQQPDGTFNVVTYTVGFQNSPSWSITAGDIDGNGYNDLMFGGGSRVSFVYANEDGTDYSEVFIDEYIFSQRTNMADIDNDGHLDAFACHDVDQSHPYRNDGNGNLVEDQTLIQTVDITGNYASVFVDFDNDGDTDMYLTKCSGGNPVGHPANQNRLYVNDGNGVYTEEQSTYGLYDDEKSWVTIFEDFDNDGDFDAFTVNHSGGNKLKENDGTGHFTDITAGSGINAGNLGSWALMGADFDNDGWVDFLMESNAGQRLHHNNGDGTFTTIATEFDEGALGDLNNDGFIDVWGQAASGSTKKLWMNDGNSNNWTKVGLEGVESNRNGIGARVEAHGDFGIKIRECRAGQDFQQMSTLDVMIGLGTATEMDSIVVKWPSGTKDVFINPPINERLVLVEGTGSIPEPVTMEIQVILEGTYDSTAGLMTDNLRVSGDLPTTEPFTDLGFVHKGGGGETIAAGILGVTGANAVVDWIFVEIRNGEDPLEVLETKSCLVKRNGSITDTDDNEIITFNLPSGGDFLVALRHRNHMGCRTLNPTPNNSGTDHTFDFTDGSLTLYGTEALNDVNGIMMLIPGDPNLDGQVNFVDKNLFWRAENGTPFDYILDPSDFNMDGTVNSIDLNFSLRPNVGKAEQLD